MTKNSIKKQAVIILAVAVAMAILGFCLGYFLFPEKTRSVAPPETAPEAVPKSEESKEIETAEETLPETEEVREPMSKTPLMKGIDVSKWQGKPDWKKIADSGVEFAMIRIGFHGTSGSFGEDPQADYNLKNADANGILTGVYFYSLAKSVEEAGAEALWVLERVGDYAISLPIVIDYEMMENDASLSAQKRTDIALAFLRTVHGAGYEAMIYVPITEWNDPNLWEKERIAAEFSVWGADYETSFTEENQHPDGVTDYAMWQYSNTGRVSGISGNVDLNLAYFNAERRAPRKEENASFSMPDEYKQSFTPAGYYVTAKIEVNLRKTPSTEGKIVAMLHHGTYLRCLGEGDRGWSLLEYDGKLVYAVASYLETA